MPQQLRPCKCQGHLAASCGHLGLGAIIGATPKPKLGHDRTGSGPGINNVIQNYLSVVCTYNAPGHVVTKRPPGGFSGAAIGVFFGIQNSKSGGKCPENPTTKIGRPLSSSQIGLPRQWPRSKIDPLCLLNYFKRTWDNARKTFWHQNKAAGFGQQPQPPHDRCITSVWEWPLHLSVRI